jgi:DNA-binding NarL/FixJ family response regulator
MENDSPTNDKQSFTKKELVVIEQLMEGKSNKLIALQLGITARAVELHLTHVYVKLGVSCRTEAAIKLVRLFKKIQDSGIRS